MPDRERESLVNQDVEEEDFLLQLPPSRPRPATELAKSAIATFKTGGRAEIHPSGAAIVKAPDGFAARASLVRSLSAAADVTPSPLRRRKRGRALDEPLGGEASPIVEIVGRVDLVLGPEPGRRLHLLSVRDEPLYLREDLLAAFDRSITYENGRLPVEEGDERNVIPMVQLRGMGVVIASIPDRFLTIEVTEGRRAIVRGDSVIGWTGRLVPRALPAVESVAGAKGLVALAGEGMVLVDGR
jgi:uncharacterized protein (AIM24 family)